MRSKLIKISGKCMFSTLILVFSYYETLKQVLKYKILTIEGSCHTQVFLASDTPVRLSLNLILLMIPEIKKLEMRDNWLSPYT